LRDAPRNNIADGRHLVADGVTAWRERRNHRPDSRRSVVTGPDSLRIVRAMPVVASSSYRPPFYLGNAHLQTVWPTLFRKVKGVDFERVRLPTADGDFLLLDWLRGSSPGVTLAILSHGSRVIRAGRT